jgi:hypothetical protein
MPDPAARASNRRFGAQFIGAAKPINGTARAAQGRIAHARPKPRQSPVASAARRNAGLDHNLVNALETFAGFQGAQTYLTQFGMRSNFTLHLQ